MERKIVSPPPSSPPSPLPPPQKKSGLRISCKREYLEEPFLWNLFCQVVVALEFCHGRVGKGGVRMPIIHRDLKPENVFLTDDNVVKVI